MARNDASAAGREVVGLKTNVLERYGRKSPTRAADEEK